MESRTKEDAAAGVEYFLRSIRFMMADKPSSIKNDRASRSSSGEIEDDADMSAQGACAAPLPRVSSLTLPKGSSGDYGEMSQTPIDSVPYLRDRNYASATGCITPHQGEIFPGQLGDTSQDISLGGHFIDYSRKRNVPPSSAPCTPCTRASPPSLASINNVASTGALPNPVRSESNPEMTESRVMQESMVANLQRLTLLGTDGRNPYYVSEPTPTRDDADIGNYNASYADAGLLMTARPMAEGACAVTSPCEAQQNSGLSQGTEIAFNCPLRKLPNSILDLISSEMVDPDNKGSWLDLVEMYGWNYDQSMKFTRKHAKGDIFAALLKEQTFQTYTLSKFQEDLQGLPRIDLLNDLNDEIAMYNSKVVR
ncbi:hypothetical protein PoB_001582000 [Plakobranchus ocellatus]|uniref:SAM domain-containing protein n=1 Tax=Plakobranchus ocellatus TaxID=259542 RepID=A0AAV3Z1Q0_9GAST|nr:hypothetical protein PoB_001582000 [Plakobranchus ocellatus]